MSKTQERSTNRDRRSSPLLRNLFGFLLIPALAVLVVLAAAVVGLLAFENSYENRIYPGVVIWGVDLSGKSPDEASEALAAAFPYPSQMAFRFRDPGTGQEWVATPAQLGVSLDAEASAARAYQVGRGGGAWNDLSVQADTYLYGQRLAPILVFDNSAAISFLENIALEVFQPVVDAGLVFAEDELVSIPSQVGRQMNIADAYNQLAAPLGTLGGAEIDLLVDETLPVITDAMVAEIRTIAEQITDQPLSVYLAETVSEDDPPPQTLSREELANLLILELDDSANPPHYTIRVDEAALTDWLEPLAPLLETKARNARFIFNDDTEQLELLENSVPARQLNVAATVQQIMAQITTDERDVPLVIEWVRPLANEDATAEELGITELVATGQTQFTGSSEVRVHNVATAAARFHGIVIGPGEVFSFNEHLGDVSLETGFEEGLIIFGGRTIKGVGGGVCQVSTTAFQAAFYAGFPVLERTPHGYRVAYYEYGEGPGMDATVFSPDVDLKFVNDTPYHLLIETYTNEEAQRLTFKFYSTSDGRTVEKADVQIYDEIPHPPDLYEEDPELEAGEIEKVDWAADGARVLIKRIVRSADGSILREDTFSSHYLPWQAVYHYGPGTENMPPPEDASDEDATPTPEGGD